MIAAHTRLSKQEIFPLFIATTLVMLSRLPFLSPSYGRDPDAYRVVMVARQIAETGDYTASRLPGYPLHEYLLAFTPAKDDPFTSNALTAVSSVIAFVFFALILRYFKVKPYLLLSLAFAAVPVIYINSVTTMDYMFALACMLASLYFTLLNRPILAGLLLGLAIGFRITSGALLLPLAYWLVSVSSFKRAVKPLLKLGITAGIVSLVVYLPVLNSYGLNFFTFYDIKSYPPLLEFISLAVTKVWETFGTLGVAAAAAAVLIALKNESPFRDQSERIRIAVMCVLGIAIFVIAFLRLPLEAAYMIPIVPFVLLLIGLILPKHLIAALSIVLLIAPFVTISTGGISLNGPIIHDHKIRADEVEMVDRVLNMVHKLPEGSVIVAGTLLPEIEVREYGMQDDAHELLYLVDSEEVFRQYDNANRQVYYIPGMESFNRRIYGIDLAALGAQPLSLD